MTPITPVHEFVSDAYTRAVTSPSASGCCSGGAPKGTLAKIAGYAGDDLAELPADAVKNSFGCGNPLAFSDVRPGDVVLDLGSGAGIDLLIAAKKVGPTGRVIGVDMTDAMIAKARANIAAAGLPNVEVRKGLIEDLPVESASVDWVISNCVINLSPDKPRVFAEIARVLKPGGRMRVSDIMVEDVPDAVRKSQALYGCCVAGAISEAEYLAGLRAAGLVDVEVRERIIYDAAQLRALAGSEVLQGKSTSDLLATLAGKVWSAIVNARRAGPGC
jgi:SAM-dependent methyltransferase